MLLPQEIIRHKRDGQTLSSAQITAFIEGVTANSVTDAQIAAFTMAVFWRGLSLDERTELTLAMRNSGKVLQWGDLGPVVDKHSTGGVGDKTSLILAPLLAAYGAHVPMIAGRGLGHAGGTIDKLESIPGFKTDLSLDDFQLQVRRNGCAIIGQTAELAPADGRMYAVRDTVGTVESRDLITASILSKKLAAGLQTLVMDVKYGNGAYLTDYGAAKGLAQSIVTVANKAGLKTVAHLTDMNQVLGDTAGNALEVAECVAWLKGKRVNSRLKEVTLLLAAEMAVAAGLATSPEAARAQCEKLLATGQAAERFAAMVKAQGGPADFMERSDDYLPKAPVVRPVPSPQTGFVGMPDVRGVGVGIINLGGGRIRPGQRIDPSVGLSDVLGVGATVQAGDPLALVHAPTESAAEAAVAHYLVCSRIAEAPPVIGPIQGERLTG